MAQEAALGVAVTGHPAGDPWRMAKPAADPARRRRASPDQPGAAVQLHVDVLAEPGLPGAAGPSGRSGGTRGCHRRSRAPSHGRGAGAGHARGAAVCPQTRRSVTSVGNVGAAHCRTGYSGARKPCPRTGIHALGGRRGAVACRAGTGFRADGQVRATGRRGRDTGNRPAADAVDVRGSVCGIGASAGEDGPGDPVGSPGSSSHACSLGRTRSDVRRTAVGRDSSDRTRPDSVGARLG